MMSGLTLVLGGAASGKSAFAEGLAESLAANRLYIATARAHDAEMEHKINVHQSRRGTGWRTIEAPDDPEAALAEARSGEIVLFDCATMWLSNAMLAERALDQATDNLLSALAACSVPVVMVTNEVGSGIVPENTLARAFREEQGRLNISLAAQARTVVQVIAGLPNVLKGELP